jgi:hypothetical protein
MRTKLIIALMVLFPIFSFAQNDSAKAKPRIGFVSINAGYGLPLLHSGDFTTGNCLQATVNAQLPIEGGNFDFFAVRLSYSRVPIYSQYMGMNGGWPTGYSNGNAVYFDTYNIVIGPFYSSQHERVTYDFKLLFGTIFSNEQSINPYRGLCVGLSGDIRLKISGRLFAIITLDALTNMLDGSLGIGYKLF